MRTLILLCYLTFLSLNSSGQVVIFNDDFELSTAFTFSGDLTPNNWRVNSCTGNGSSFGGSNSLYISQGGVALDCGPTGDYQYGYVPSPAGTRTVMAITEIDALCFGNLSYSFDYLNTLDNTTDFGQIVYSTNSGVSWDVLTTIGASGSWTTTTGTLPAVLNNTEFQLGITFNYDDGPVSGLPIAIDNISIEGVSTDIISPTITCETEGLIELDGSCQAIVNLLEKYALTVSDNCTDSVAMSYIYNPPAGTILVGNAGDFVSVDLIAVDENGNQSNTCTISLELVDLGLPVITSCQSDTTVFLNSNCEYVMGDFTPFILATDNCSVLTYSQSVPTATAVSGVQTTSIILTAADNSGNSANCSFNLTTVDTILPTITCPANQIVYTNTSCQGTLLDYTALAVYSDNCIDNLSMTLTQSPLPGFTIAADQIITFQLTGGVPSTPRECSFTVQLIDTIDPSISCPISPILYLDNNCERILQDYTGSILWSDNCESVFANMTVTQNPAPLTVLSVTTSVEITITDPSGNSSTCDFNVVLQDTIHPTIICPVDTTQARNAICQVELNDFTGLAIGTDNCTLGGSLVYSQSPAPASVITIPTTVTISVSDASMNQQSCQFLVTPIDTTAPVLICPTSIQISSDLNCQYLLADESGIISADDNCSSSTSLIVTQSPIIGTTLSIGTTPILFTYEDASGNSNSCSVNLNIVDLMDPIITVCPPTTTIYSDQNCDIFLADYTTSITATDNCTAFANLAMSQSPIAGTPIIASQVVTLIITDEAGNDTQCSFSVNVLDTIAPTIVCPNDINISINNSCQFVTPDFGPSVTGSDNCSAFGNMTIMQNPAATTNQSGITPVTITLTDEQGNSSTCIVIVTPIDTIAPVVTCPTIPTVNNGANCNYALPDYGAMATISDNCVTFSVTQNPAPGTSIPAGTTNINITVIDAVGNDSECNFPLTVLENQAPTITCPANIQSCDPMITYLDPTFSDNCIATISQTDLTGLSSGDIFPIGTTILEYTVIDASGNTDNCTFIVEVLESPNATILEDTIALCDVNSVLLEAQPANGVWTIIEGQGNFNNQFAFQTGVNNLSNGTSIFVWMVATASCGVESDTVVVINSIAPSPANTQDTMLACGVNFINLFTATPINGTGLWTTLQGGTIANPSASVTTASNLADGWNDFIWTVSNPGCPSNSDTMRVLSTGNVQIFSNDTTFCFDDENSITLNGSVPGNDQSVVWNFATGSGMFSNPNSSTTTVTTISLGENVITYTINYELCPADVDSILVLTNICDGFEPVFPTVITPNADGKNDVFEIQNLEKIYPNCTMTIFNRWGSVVFESVGYADPWNGTFNGEKLPMGTYFFKLELNDEQNQHYNGPISIIH